MFAGPYTFCPLYFHWRNDTPWHTPSSKYICTQLDIVWHLNAYLIIRACFNCAKKVAAICVILFQLRIIFNRTVQASEAPHFFKDTCNDQTLEFWIMRVSNWNLGSRLLPCTWLSHSKVGSSQWQKPEGCFRASHSAPIVADIPNDKLHYNGQERLQQDHHMYQCWLMWRSMGWRWLSGQSHRLQIRKMKWHIGLLREAETS